MVLELNWFLLALKEKISNFFSTNLVTRISIAQITPNLFTIYF